MKLYQLTTLFFSLLSLLNSCEKSVEDVDLIQNEWKVQSVVLETKYFTTPSDHTFFQERAYILKFLNDSCFVMNTSVNEAGGKYQIVSEEKIIIKNYQEWTEVGNVIEHQQSFDEQLLSTFNGAMSYSYSKNKLVFQGEQNKKVVFVKQKYRK